RALSLTQLEQVYAIARTQMLANLGPGLRTTRAQLAGTPSPADRSFVASRPGKPCVRCGAAIECYSLGEPPRWTWSCPRCQPMPQLVDDATSHRCVRGRCPH